MVVVLYGNDASRMQYKLKKIIDQQHPDSVIRFDALEQSQDGFLESLDSMNLFMETDMLVVENALFLSSRNTTKWSLERVAQKLKNTDKPVVFLMEPKPDSRKKLIKQICADASVIECKKLDDQSAAQFIKDLASEKKVTLEPKALERMVRYGGRDCLVLEDAVERLSIYSSHITEEDVKALVPVSPEDNVFEMTNALFSRNGARLISLYRDFRSQSMEPLAISGLLASQIRFLFQVRVLMEAGRSQKQIAEELSASPGRIWNTMKNANRFKARELMEWLEQLSLLDQSLKSVQIDRDLLFEDWILHRTLRIE